MNLEKNKLPGRFYLDNIFNIFIKSCNLFVSQRYHGRSVEDNVPKKST